MHRLAFCEAMYSLNLYYTMKRIITTILAASMMLAGFSAAAQVSVGAGYVNSAYKTKTTSGSSTSKTSSPAQGFYVGADYDIPIVGGLSMVPGIYYTFATASKSSSILSLASGTGTTTEMYVGVPVNFTYSLEFGNEGKIYVFAGPTFNVGVMSQYKLDATSIVGDYSTKTDNYDDSDYSRFEMLIGGGVGLQYGAIGIKVGYDANLLNRYTGDNASNYYMGRNQLHAGVVYSF